MPTLYSQSTLKAGKLPANILDALLSELKSNRSDPRLLVGPRTGEDAAHIAFGERTLLAKTDPITFTTDQIGWYAINVNANDIAVAGGQPKWFLATLLMPTGSTVQDVETIFQQLDQAAGEIGVTLAGGHTEITHAVSQPVICGFMLGEAPASGTVSSSGAKPGDAVILTKGIAIEGTAILADQFSERLLASGITESQVQAASDLLHDPGISVLKDAQAAVAAGGVTAMHDPTEGGLATAIHELSFASNVDVEIEEEKVDILPLCSAICQELDVDPWGLISSGALLATVTQGAEEATLESIRSAGIQANIIGRVTGHIKDGCSSNNVIRAAGGSTRALPEFERDELARILEMSL